MNQQKSLSRQTLLHNALQNDLAKLKLKGEVFLWPLPGLEAMRHHTSEPKTWTQLLGRPPALLYKPTPPGSVLPRCAVLCHNNAVPCKPLSRSYTHRAV